MKYLLVVLTHGDNAYCLDRTITSFQEHVRPAPAQRLVVQDGPCALPPLIEGDDNEWACFTIPKATGFCAAVGVAWQTAQLYQPDYVFWLEHDFVFTRDVDVNAMRTILDGDHSLAQVSLMRGPATQPEEDAGGVVEDIRRRGFGVSEYAGWLRHKAYFTTNPSLMRGQFMRDNPWQTRAECEGRYGVDLVGKGYSFGVLGHGEPWVEHIGVRTGMGY